MDMAINGAPLDSAYRGGHVMKTASRTVYCTDAEDSPWCSANQSATQSSVIKRDPPYGRQCTITLPADEVARRLMDMLEREGAMHMSSLVRELELCGMMREQNSGA